MNCQKCNAVNKLGSKFCTSCGYSLSTILDTEISVNCQKCNATLKPGMRFCTSCGTPVKNQVSLISENNDTAIQKPLSLIKDRIFWNVQNGEVAHRFNEVEMMQYDSAKGIIINEGTTAFIKANGLQVAEIKGGTYDFIEPQKLDETLSQRQGGISGGIRAGFRFLSNLVLGRSVKDSILANEPTQNSKQETTMASLIESMKKGQVFSVTLKLNKSFPLYFEIKELETSILNATFGVHAYFRIDDFAKFSEYYLSDSNSASLVRIQSEFEPIIKASIQEIVHNYELKEGRLPDEILQKIKERIELSATDFMQGLKLEKIVEISSKSDDLARFRELSRELYLSEKELEYLIKTNEFRNRLTLTQNTQRLTEAKTDAEFYRELTAINLTSSQERLLSEDEMEKFYMLLSREKRIREAKNEDEISAAFIEIEKTGLLRAEDLVNLKRSISEQSEDHNFQRFHSLTLLQMNQTLEIERKKLEWEYEIGDKRIDLDISRRRNVLQAEIGYTQLEIERWITEDNYKDTVFYKDLEKRKAAQIMDIDIRKSSRETDIELDNKEMDAQLERMRKLKEMESVDAKLKHEQEITKRAQEFLHQQEMEEKRLKEISIKYEVSKNLSPEQLMAIAANEKLDPIAAQKFAESFAAKHNTEHQKEFMDQFNRLNDERIKDSKEMMDRMERMYNKGLDSSAVNTGHLINHKNQQKDEYKERLEKQEVRMDKTQDKALDYTTRNNSFGNTNTRPNIPTPPSDYFVNLPGENNIPRKIEVLINMVKSGQITNTTYIFTPQQNGWLVAESIPDLKPYFLPNSNSEFQGSSENITCKNCGFMQVEKNARFCPECGNEP